MEQTHNGGIAGAQIGGGIGTVGGAVAGIMNGYLPEMKNYFNPGPPGDLMASSGNFLPQNNVHRLMDKPFAAGDLEYLQLDNFPANIDPTTNIVRANQFPIMFKDPYEIGVRSGLNDAGTIWINPVRVRYEGL